MNTQQKIEKKNLKARKLRAKFIKVRNITRNNEPYGGVRNPHKSFKFTPVIAGGLLPVSKKYKTHDKQVAKS